MLTQERLRCGLLVAQRCIFSASQLLANRENSDTAAVRAAWLLNRADRACRSASRGAALRDVADPQARIQLSGHLSNLRVAAAEAFWAARRTSDGGEIQALAFGAGVMISECRSALRLMGKSLEPQPEIIPWDTGRMIVVSETLRVLNLCNSDVKRLVGEAKKRGQISRRSLREFLSEYRPSRQEMLEAVQLFEEMGVTVSSPSKPTASQSPASAVREYEFYLDPEWLGRPLCKALSAQLAVKRTEIEDHIANGRLLVQGKLIRRVGEAVLSTGPYTLLLEALT